MDYKEFKKKLIDNDLTLKEFSNLSNTSYSTCLKWGKENRPVPNWVQPFLSFYSENVELKKEVEKSRNFKEEFYEMMNGQTITVK